jgi:KipI family sensor histidine kinase inhibitor
VKQLPVGPDAVLVEVDSTAEALALYDAARDAGVRAQEIVPAARTVLFDGITTEARAWLNELRRVDLPAHERRRHVEIPVVYDGPDLADTAHLLSMTTDELVGLHGSTTFTVAFCGFSPGFAYCTGLPVSVPRLDSPRPRVEPGSVGLAGEFTGVYPSASPGGWRLIGRTDVNLWDTSREEPALLSPGTTVRFVAGPGDVGP